MREGHGHQGKRGHRDPSEHRGHGHFNKENRGEMSDHQHKKAQTFRRGRAIAFLDKLNINRSTLQRQLNDPELEAIKQVISGELKATEAIIEEFIHMFQLHEILSEATPSEENNTEGNELNNENH